MVQDRKSKVVSVVPVVDTAIYASGDRLGSLMTITGATDATGDTVVLKSLIIIDGASQSSAVDVLFFSDAPTIASADNAALNITDAQMSANFLGRIVVASGDYTALSANSVAAKNSVDMMLKSIAGSRDLYCLLQARGTPTYTSASDLTVKFLFEQY